MLNGKTAIDGLLGSANGSAQASAARCRLPVFPSDPKDTNRPLDVLQRPLSEILEGEGQALADLVAHRGGDDDAARLGYALEPRRDIDAVAEDVVAFDDHVAKIDADAELDPAVGRQLSLRPAMPRWIAAEQATALTTLGNSTSMPSPISLTIRPRCSAMLVVDEFLAMGVQSRQGAGLVEAHQPGIADHVGSKDRGKAALHLDPTWLHEITGPA